MSAEEEQGLKLIEAVDKTLPRMRTKSLDLSFNELAEMYKARELVIDPEFQRYFRWSEEQQSRFIESLILELPIPPIFVVERSTGVYELVDGLQRLSSYLHFIGQLRTLNTEADTPLELSGCDMVKELNGQTFDSLPQAIRLKVKRYFVRVEVVKKESDYEISYHVFKRLNTGGEPLNDQEVRNCSIRLLDKGKFISLLAELKETGPFKTCMDPLSEEARSRRQDEEYVLRFFAFKNDRSNFKHHVGDFMTAFAEKVATGAIPFDYHEERTVFQQTFGALNIIMGRDVFCRFMMKNSKKLSAGQLRPNYFEAFSLGILPHLDRLDLADVELLSRLSNALTDLRFDKEFAQVTGAGVNYPGPLNERILLVTRTVERVLDGTN